MTASPEIYPPEMIMSHLGHTTRFIQSFRITETFEASSVFNMPTDKLLYDDRHWQEILEKDIRKISLERKLHLIFTVLYSGHVSSNQHCATPTIYIHVRHQRSTGKGSKVLGIHAHSIFKGDGVPAWNGIWRMA